MSEIRRLVEECAKLLEQGRSLCAALSPTAYAASLPGAAGGVGAQLRHCLDAFGCLLAGWPSGAVDFDRRARDPLVERDPRAAMARVDALVAALRREIAGAADCPLRVRADEPSLAPELGWTRSSLARELRVLASHTLHHYALVAQLLRAQGLEAPSDFGVAPATRAHRLRADASGSRAALPAPASPGARRRRAAGARSGA